VPEQIWPERGQSRRRCGRGEPSRSAEWLRVATFSGTLVRYTVSTCDLSPSGRILLFRFKCPWQPTAMGTQGYSGVLRSARERDGAEASTCSASKRPWQPHPTPRRGRQLPGMVSRAARCPRRRGGYPTRQRYAPARQSPPRLGHDVGDECAARAVGHPTRLSGNPTRLSGNPTCLSGNPTRLSGNPTRLSGNPTRLSGNSTLVTTLAMNAPREPSGIVLPRSSSHTTTRSTLKWYSAPSPT
jgi:hypothetical protein